jgi:hypothetical protein
MVCSFLSSLAGILAKRVDYIFLLMGGDGVFGGILPRCEKNFLWETG